MKRLSLLLLVVSVLAPQSKLWPASKAVTLSGKPIIVPGQLAATNVLVAGFTKKSRAQTEAWSNRLRNDARVAKIATVYDVIVLDGVPGFIRSMIVKQITSGLPRERHDRFLVVTEDVSTWRTFLDARNEDDAYVAVLSAKGAVAWRHQGELNEAAYRQLLGHLE